MGDVSWNQVLFVRHLLSCHEKHDLKEVCSLAFNLTQFIFPRTCFSLDSLEAKYRDFCPPAHFQILLNSTRLVLLQNVWNNQSLFRSHSFDQTSCRKKSILSIKRLIGWLSCYQWLTWEELVLEKVKTTVPNQGFREIVSKVLCSDSTQFFCCLPHPQHILQLNGHPRLLLWQQWEEGGISWSCSFQSNSCHCF